MAGSAFRDEDDALLEQRSRLLAQRRASEARAAARARIAARRITRTGWAAASIAALLFLLALDLARPDAVATPVGLTPLGQRLVLAPIAMLLVFLASPLLARRARMFVVTSDVRADVDRLREPLQPSPPQRPGIVAASFALPLAVAALWPSMLALHGAIDLEREPLRYYEMMPGLVERRMGASEALAELLAGGALLSALSTIAYGFAIWRVLGRASGTDTATAFARGFGGLFFGALLGQIGAGWMEESARSVAFGYASLALGASLGVLGGGALFALVMRVREREQKQEEA